MSVLVQWIHFFGSSDFLPHGHCFLWRPALLWSVVLGEVLIALAYCSIPISIMFFLSRRHDIEHAGIFHLFSYFIAACSMTHFMDIWVIWHPDYWLQAMVLLVTAALSIWTAVALWKSIPQALRIPSIAQMNESVHHLENVVAELHTAQNQLIEREKQAALGALVAGLAHELNTPLGNALTVATTLHDQDVVFKQQLGSSLSRRELVQLLDTQTEGLSLLLTSLQRANVLIDQFKLLAWEESSDQFQRVQLVEWLAECICAAKARSSKPVLQARMDISSQIALRTAPTVLAQVLMTLFGFVQGRSLHREHVAVELSARICENAIELMLMAPSVCLNEDELRHVFEPFYASQLQSTQDTLGMHVAFQLVERVLRGCIQVCAHGDQGTQFLLHLPQVT